MKKNLMLLIFSLILLEVKNSSAVTYTVDEKTGTCPTKPKGLLVDCRDMTTCDTEKNLHTAMCQIASNPSDFYTNTYKPFFDATNNVLNNLANKQYSSLINSLSGKSLTDYNQTYGVNQTTKKFELIPTNATADQKANYKTLCQVLPSSLKNCKLNCFVLNDLINGLRKYPDLISNPDDLYKFFDGICHDDAHDLANLMQNTDGINDSESKLMTLLNSLAIPGIKVNVYNKIDNNKKLALDENNDPIYDSTRVAPLQPDTTGTADDPASYNIGSVTVPIVKNFDQVNLTQVNNLLQKLSCIYSFSYSNCASKSDRDKLNEQKREFDKSQKSSKTQQWLTTVSSAAINAAMFTGMGILAAKYFGSAGHAPGSLSKLAKDAAPKTKGEEALEELEEVAPEVEEAEQAAASATKAVEAAQQAGAAATDVVAMEAGLAAAEVATNVERVEEATSQATEVENLAKTLEQVE